MSGQAINYLPYFREDIRWYDSSLPKWPPHPWGRWERPWPWSYPDPWPSEKYSDVDVGIILLEKLYWHLTLRVMQLSWPSPLKVTLTLLSATILWPLFLTLSFDMYLLTLPRLRFSAVIFDSDFLTLLLFHLTTWPLAHVSQLWTCYLSLYLDLLPLLHGIFSPFVSRPWGVLPWFTSPICLWFWTFARLWLLWQTQLQVARPHKHQTHPASRLQKRLGAILVQDLSRDPAPSCSATASIF